MISAASSVIFQSRNSFFGGRGFIQVFIQFSFNHFSFYSVLVFSSFIHFSSYSVLVQAFIIILVNIQFLFLIKQ